MLGEAKNQAAAAATRVSLNAERQPPLVQGLVKSVVSATTNSMMGGVRNQLNAAWVSEVVNVYRQSLAGRYPMSAGSSRDATLDDFGQFFGVGGVMVPVTWKSLLHFTPPLQETCRGPTHG